MATVLKDRIGSATWTLSELQGASNTSNTNTYSLAADVYSKTHEECSNSLAFQLKELPLANKCNLDDLCSRRTSTTNLKVTHYFPLAI